MVFCQAPIKILTLGQALDIPSNSRPYRRRAAAEAAGEATGGDGAPGSD